LPTCGLQPLLDIHFEKAHGAPVSWETFNRSKPQNDLETDKIGGIQKEASYLHSHFHIFASLPGLNMYFSLGLQPCTMSHSKPNALIQQIGKAKCPINSYRQHWDVRLKRR